MAQPVKVQRTFGQLTCMGERGGLEMPIGWTFDREAHGHRDAKII